jgi:hypothetical protein
MTNSTSATKNQDYFDDTGGGVVGNTISEWGIQAWGGGSWPAMAPAATTLTASRSLYVSGTVGSTYTGNILGYSTVGPLATCVAATTIASANRYYTTTAFVVHNISAYFHIATANTNLQFALYADTNGSPGTMLITTPEQTSIALGTGWYSSPLSITLAANSTYWAAYTIYAAGNSCPGGNANYWSPSADSGDINFTQSPGAAWSSSPPPLGKVTSLESLYLS